MLVHLITVVVNVLGTEKSIPVPDILWKVTTFVSFFNNF